MLLAKILTTVLPFWASLQRSLTNKEPSLYTVSLLVGLRVCQTSINAREDAIRMHIMRMNVASLIERECAQNPLSLPSAICARYRPTLAPALAPTCPNSPPRPQRRNTCPAGPPPTTTSPAWMHLTLGNALLMCPTFYPQDEFEQRVAVCTSLVVYRPAFGVAVRYRLLHTAYMCMIPPATATATATAVVVSLVGFVLVCVR
ncbi:hypothetical protein C0992_006696 [Termitomyces sp. T32_za158]|nr:hypothetical protein C0992_006696 [Termitomyces sp. T32_za158]